MGFGIAGIPAIVAEIRLAADRDGVRVAAASGGSAQSLSLTHTYFLVSNNASASDGQSLLHAIKLALEASLPGTVFYVRLDPTTYRVRISHDNASSLTLEIDTALGERLGFPNPASISVPTGGNGVLATFPSRWWWSPGIVVSETGPELFDPYTSIGIPESAGSAQWSTSMVAAYISHGTQTRAIWEFFGVEGYEKIRTVPGFDYQDWEGFWDESMRLGRRVLIWRNRDDATSAESGTPEAEGYPPKYVIYQPSDVGRRTPNFRRVTDDPNTNLWTVVWDLWVTSMGATIYDDPQEV